MELRTTISRTLFSLDLSPVGQKPPATLLLVHGAGGSHQSWRLQHPLSRHIRLIEIGRAHV